MDGTRPPKKGETLEVRLPHAAKAAFMAHCRREGRTASETVRRLIDGEMSSPSRRRPSARGTVSRWWRAIVAALAGLVVGGIAAPSLAHSSSACRPPGVTAPGATR